MATNAGGVTISLSGFAELATALQRFPEAAAEVMASATLQAGLVVSEDAQRRVPVDTGALRRSIHPEYVEQTSTSAIVAVGTELPYGKFVEFGTSRMAARPFLRPALDENHDAIEKEFVDAFKELAYEELDSHGPRGGIRSK